MVSLFLTYLFILDMLLVTETKCGEILPNIRVCCYLKKYNNKVITQLIDLQSASQSVHSRTQILS